MTYENGLLSTRPRPGSALHRWAAVFVGFFLSACADDNVEGWASDEPAALRVMVVDQGFDLAEPSVQGRIEAAYTIACREVGAANVDTSSAPAPYAGLGANPTNGEYEAAKAEMLARLAAPERACELSDGIAPMADPLRELALERTRWNSAVVANRMDSVADLVSEVVPRIDVTATHGTATASIIARSNPAARLILVEVAFTTSDSIGVQPSCLTQGDVDEAVALLSDAAVRAAYLGRPESPPASLYERVMLQHGVAVVNESFARLSRVEMERVLADERCTPVELSQYFGVMSELDRSYRARHPPARALVVKAAGNAGAMLDSPLDSRECIPLDQQQLLVGSYGPTGERSSFSNFGSCVDLYAPGEEILSAMPRGWLVRSTGTSFAAPLVSRLLSMAAPRPFDVERARATVLAMRNSDGRVPPEFFSSDLTFYSQPETSAVAAQALSVERSATPDDAQPSNPSRPRDDAQPSNQVVRKELTWPLHFVRERRQSREWSLEQAAPRLRARRRPSFSR